MPNTKKIQIRMYNVGLGDSFLLRFPGDDREHNVLIDCGVHPSGPGPYTMEQVVDQIIGDVTDGDAKPRIDVVIATHRHRDHVLGFENKRWREVEVGEVWMPWTEDPKDPQAKEIRDKQSKKAIAIQKALKAMGAPLALLEIVDNSLTNAKAMATLHGGFANKAKVRYLPPKTRSKQSFRTDLLPGVTVHAMGPSRDPDVIRDMDPPKGGAYELRLAAASGNGNGSSAGLFAKSFALTGTELATQLASFNLTKRNLRDLEKLADEDPFAIAVQLDKAVNGTSLLLMFESGDAHLLFPGDAQWGTWQNALADAEFRELLGKTNFLKVGHHGSHNATPKAFVETILEKGGFSAMVCTRETKKFKKIPLPSLLKALGQKSNHHIARSDETASVKGFKRDGDVYTDATVAV
ncbi:MAG: MBL fold metallo-hydrolase [Thermoanaerobaculia bacterium]|jgi:beta-lactamase superfamily II metal-dependent hydrolase